MADLKTNYVDDVLDTTKNQLRKYRQIQNDDGTVSFVDVTEYTQVGTSFGAKDINDTNAAINDVNGKLDIKNKIITCMVTSDPNSPLGYFGRVSKEDCGLSDNEKIISISGYSKVGYPAIVYQQVSPSESIGITSGSPEYAYIHIQYITL